MRRPLRSRITAVVTWVWFALMTLSPVPLHACPVHGGDVVNGSVAMHDHVSGGGAHHHAPGTHGHQCTCPGDCCCASPVAWHAGRLPGLVVVPESLIVERHTRPTAAPLASVVDLVLPYPNGPPVLRV